MGLLPAHQLVAVCLNVCWINATWPFNTTCEHVNVFVCLFVYVAVQSYTYVWLYVCLIDMVWYEWQGEERLRDLLAVQVIIELNVAFCEHHLVNCPPSDQLKNECTYVSCTSPVLLVSFFLSLTLLTVLESVLSLSLCSLVFLASFGLRCQVNYCSDTGP